jgi:hypothetical protein
VEQDTLINCDFLAARKAYLRISFEDQATFDAGKKTAKEQSQIFQPTTRFTQSVCLIKNSGLLNDQWTPVQESSCVYHILRFFIIFSISCWMSTTRIISGLKLNIS